MSNTSDEYRITFQIERKRPEDEDFEEVGFGSSGAWDTIAAAEHDMGSIIGNFAWENEPHQPTPDDLKGATR